MFGAADDWIDALYGQAVADPSPEPEPPPLPLWLPEIEVARRDGRIRDPFDEAIKLARGE